MNTTEQKKVQEVVAYARRVHVSPRKARLVAQLVKKLPVDEALDQLRFVTKKAVTPISKLINSAVANASHNFQIEREKLFIKNLTVDGGPVYKKFSPRAQGRAFTVRKRTSHLSVVLGVSLTPFKKRAPLKKLEPAAAQENQEEIKPKTESGEKKKFKFWQRGSKRQDTRGKKESIYDRRGNM